MLDIKEQIVKIKLPSEMTIHIPALGDMSVEDTMRVVNEMLPKMLERKVKDLVMDKIMNNYGDMLDNAVDKYLDKNIIRVYHGGIPETTLLLLK